jgi:1,4-alpha-glucan branching enzyme
MKKSTSPVSAPLLVLFSILLLISCSIPRPRTELTKNGVRFALPAPQARSVAVAGDFNHWDREKNRLTGPDEKGFWTATISLPRGRYEYLFLIDGTTWVSDPAAPSLPDGMGGINSVVFVDSGR